MLQTIEVEIDPSGYIHPVESLASIPSGRTDLTLLPSPEKIEFHTPVSEVRSAAKALELLASPRFAKRPAAVADEVKQRIEELRNDWDGR